MKRMSEKKKELARNLFAVGAVDCVNMHRLKLHENNPDAPLSPFFFNLRTPENPKPGPLTPEIVGGIAEMFREETLKTDGFNFLIGVPNAADPIVEELARRMCCEEQVLHLTKEVIGDKRSIAGFTEESKKKIFGGALALLYDDLTTKADSKLEAISQIEKEWLIVSGVIVLIDREQGGAKQLADAGYEMYSIFTLSELLEFYLDEGLISQEKYEQIREYIRENG